MKLNIVWGEWFKVHIAWPLLVQLALSIVVWFVAQPTFRRAYARRASTWKYIIDTYVGVKGIRAPRRQVVYIGVNLAQLLGSIATVTLWIKQTYVHTNISTRLPLLCLSMIDVVAWLLHRTHRQFTLRCAWEFNAIVDVLTATPTIRAFFFEEPQEIAAQWLSLHFLQTYSVLFCFELIQTTNMFKHQKVLVQMSLRLMLQIICLITIGAGMMFVLETLGDPDFLFDSFVETRAGDSISFVQMAYWFVVTVTTVGYGDFAPKSVLARMLTGVIVVAGVVSIYVIQVNFTEAWQKHREGSGFYVKKSGRRHVVVILSLKGSPSKLHSLLSGYLTEILHKAHRVANSKDSTSPSWPDVVVLAPDTWTQRGDTFADFLYSRDFSSEVTQRISYIVGDPKEASTLERVDVKGAALTYIFSDIASENPDEDDNLSIHTAMFIRNRCPSSRLRVMLIRPESKELAVQAGIEVNRVFATREIKANILGQNVRCHGLIPTLLLMFKSSDAADEENLLRSSVSVSDRDEETRAANGHEDAGHAGKDAPADFGPRVSTGSRGRRYSFMSEDALLATLKNSDQHWDEKRNKWQECDPWYLTYFQSIRANIFGFELAEEHSGQSYQELASTMYSEIGVILLGIHDGNQLQLCPQKTRRDPLYEGQICFAIARSQQQLTPFTMKGSSGWRGSLMKIRDEQLKVTQAEGPHVSAVKVLGHKLMDRMSRLDDDDCETNSQVSLTSKSSQGTLRSSNSRRSLKSISSTKRSSNGSGSKLKLDGASSGDMPSRQVSGEDPPGSQDCAVLSDRDKKIVPKTASHAARMLRSSLTDEDELILLIVCTGSVWQQVKAMISCLHARYLPKQHPIIVLAPTPAPEDMKPDLEHRVVVVEGSCLKISTLLDVGILEARSIVIMCGEMKQQDANGTRVVKDLNAVLASQQLECWCGISRQEVYTIYEFQEGASVTLLPRLMNKPVTTIEKLFHEHVEPNLDEEDDEDEDAEQQRLSSKPINNAGPLRFSQTVGTVVQKDDSIICHPRFAAGQVFTPEIWGTMLGRMYYMPAVIEMVEALVMPHRRGQRVYPWQMCVPQGLHGRTFADLMDALLLNGIESYTKPPTSDANGSNGQKINGLNGLKEVPKEKKKLERLGPAVPLALFRMRDDLGPACSKSEAYASGTGAHWYLMLSPAKDTLLRSTDLILLLGSKNMGAKLHNLGLLQTDRSRTSSTIHEVGLEDFHSEADSHSQVQGGAHKNSDPANMLAGCERDEAPSLTQRRFYQV